MAGTPEQMAQYAKVLLEHTKNQGVPVTEVVVFKLKEPFTTEIGQQFETQVFNNAKKGKGITRSAWGNSLDDPSTLVWLMDWEKIEDHWEFWQTKEFLPVMTGINALFVEGRPLVRHYKFEPRGLLTSEFVRVVVWDEKDKTAPDEVLKDKDFGSGHSELKGAFAIDMQEETWFCTLLGYKSLEEAKQSVKIAATENHLVQLKHVI
ncbi:hypothetical protein BKA64DRAFT_609496, partial [Cadophora sp. MPI-SDFR-AT-0126]